jgi:hypothetical protein
LAARIFPSPGQQEWFYPSRFENFHSFKAEVGKGEGAQLEPRILFLLSKNRPVFLLGPPLSAKELIRLHGLKGHGIKGGANQENRDDMIMENS